MRWRCRCQDSKGEIGIWESIRLEKKWFFIYFNRWPDMTVGVAPPAYDLYAHDCDSVEASVKSAHGIP
jgi:hypothetical protein